MVNLELKINKSKNDNMKLKNINNFLGCSGKIIEIEFKEKSKNISCLIPDDQKWTSIKDVLLLEEYQRLSDFNLSNFKDGIIVDAGANTGLFSIKSSMYAKKVISIEPESLNSKLLKININRNFCRNIQTIGKGLWTEEGQFILKEGDHSGSHSIKKNGKGEKINTVSLEKIINNLKRINLLKMDIEGAEFRVIDKTPNKKLGKIDNIVAEIHGKRTEERVYNLKKKLESANFEVKILDPPSSDLIYSVKKILKNWNKLKNFSRLKIFIITSYTLFNIIKYIEPSGIKTDDLCFLYAKSKK